MDILDLQFEFQMDIEHIGDNEVDAHLFKISRTIEDTGLPKEGGVATERYTLSEAALREIAIGLEAMAKKIRDYL